MRIAPVASGQLPGQSRLFTDYLAQAGSVRGFYSNFNASTCKGIDWESRQGAGTLIRHKTVAGILERQNRVWGCHEATLKNIERLRQGASAIVTGQQAILFGGPLFTLLKALSAIKVANYLQESGVDAVPVFWIASTDHDLAEVATANFLDFAQLSAITHHPEAAAGTPVSAVHIEKGIEESLAEVEKIIGGGDAISWLRRCYVPGESFSDAFARLLLTFFSEHTGLILLDPSDPELNRAAAPLYRKAIEQSDELNAALIARSQELESSGYHAQVLVESNSGLLFELRDGKRVAVHRNNGGFKVNGHILDRREMLAAIDAAPETFNANALLRPVVQDYLLPTLAYIGGPAEVAYFAQSAVLYEKLLGRITPILPRLSATLVDERHRRLLEKYGLDVPQTFVPEDALLAEMSRRRLPAQLMEHFALANSGLESLLAPLKAGLTELDSTLTGAAETSLRKMQHQLKRLESRALRAQARKEADLTRHARQLHEYFFPHRQLQEREIAGVQFLAQHGLNLLHELAHGLPDITREHHAVWL